MIKTIILKNNFISRGSFCPRAHYKTYIKEKQTKQFQHQQGRHQSLLIACGSRGGGISGHHIVFKGDGGGSVVANKA